MTGLCRVVMRDYVKELGGFDFDLAYFFPRLTGVQGILLGLLIGID